MPSNVIKSNAKRHDDRCWAVTAIQCASGWQFVEIETNYFDKLQVGDGTTTVVILAGEFLREAKAFVEEGVHPQSIIRSFREAGRLAVEEIRRQAVALDDKSDTEMRDLLQKCAATSLNSKLV